MLRLFPYNIGLLDMRDYRCWIKIGYKASPEGIIIMKSNVSRYYIWMVYAILWGMVWLYPVLVVAVRAIREGYVFSWDGILRAWMGTLPFFLIFLLHRIPVSCLLMWHRTRVYSLSVVLLIGLFAGYRYWYATRSSSCSWMGQAYGIFRQEVFYMGMEE